MTSFDDDHHQVSVAKLAKDDRVYSAIGRFIVEFSNLEMVLKRWIADTVHLPERFHDKIMTQDFAMLCNIAQAVLPGDMKEGADKALKPIIGRFHDLNAHRVRVAHGWWLGAGQHGARHVSRQKLKSEQHYLDAQEIAALADSTVMLDGDLRDWYRKFRIKA